MAYRTTTIYRVQGAPAPALVLKFADGSEQTTASEQADWNAVSGDAMILNKPTIPYSFTFSPTLGAAWNTKIPVYNSTNQNWVAVDAPIFFSYQHVPTPSGHNGKYLQAVDGNSLSTQWVDTFTGPQVTVHSSAGLNGSASSALFNADRHFEQVTLNDNHSNHPANLSIQGYNVVRTYFKSDVAAHYGLSHVFEISDTINNGSRVGCYVLVHGHIYHSGGISQFSDDRIKSYEQDLTDATSTLLKLKPQKYQKHPDLVVDGDQSPDLTNVQHFTEVGFIAQDVENIDELKFMVTNDETSGIKQVSMLNLLGYLVKGFQELNTRLVALETRLANAGL